MYPTGQLPIEEAIIGMTTIDEHLIRAATAVARCSTVLIHEHHSLQPSTFILEKTRQTLVAPKADRPQKMFAITSFCPTTYAYLLKGSSVSRSLSIFGCTLS